MNTQIAMKVFLFFSVFFIGNYAHSDDVQDTLDTIFQHAQSAINYAEDGKIYLRSDKVYFHEGKIFIDNKYERAISIP